MKLLLEDLATAVRIIIPYDSMHGICNTSRHHCVVKVYSGMFKKSGLPKLKARSVSKSRRSFQAHLICSKAIQLGIEIMISSKDVHPCDTRSIYIRGSPHVHPL